MVDLLPLVNIDEAIDRGNLMADEVKVVEAPVAEVVTQEQAPTRTSDDPKIVDAIQKHLDAFSDVETAEIPVVETTPTETPKVEEKSVEEEVAAEEKSVEEKPVEEAVTAPVVESTLPAAYVRTAKARGWTDEEIADAVKVNPDAAMRTFERMHTSRTQEINEWADLGRKNRQTPALTATPSPAASPVAPAQVALQPINVAAMVEKYGNQGLIEELAGPVNAAIAMLGPLVTGAQESRAQARRTQQETLGKTVEDFFTAKEMAPFATAYGKSGSLTTPQVETRSKVLETADALIAGAAFQGRQLSVQDALVLAHDSVTSGLKETIIRDQIRKDVTKRAAGITLKPTATGRTQTGGPPRDRQELLGRTEDRLAKAFGRG